MRVAQKDSPVGDRERVNSWLVAKPYKCPVSFRCGFFRCGFHFYGNGVYQDPAGNRCCFPTKVRHLGWARGEELVAQSCALSVRELPPLQSGHRMLMSAINPAFGAVGITSIRKDAFRGLHASVPTV